MPMALARTPLTPSQKLDVAARAVMTQGEYGAVTRLATEYSISRPAVYAARTAATLALTRAFCKAEDELPGRAVWVDEAHVRRAIVALRVVAPNSIRDIEELLPLLYPGVQVSYGKIQSVAVDAEIHAGQFNATMPLSSIRAAALDEMFSQGEPVLAGVDLDSGALFALEQPGGRQDCHWAQVLEEGRERGLALEIVVKDAAKGIAGGVSEVFPNADQRDDCFHALYRMGKMRRRLEQRAYAAIAYEDDMARACKQALRKGRSGSDWAQRHERAMRDCEQAIALFDRFDRAMQRAREGMELVALSPAMLRDPAWMQNELESAAAQIEAMGVGQCREIARYVKNRAPGLVQYAIDLNQRLGVLSARYGQEPVTRAAVFWRLRHNAAVGHRPWQRGADHRRILAIYAALHEGLGRDAAETLLTEVSQIFEQRHRASSAVEGFNAALRPYLYIHKCSTPGFLQLFRAYYNLRTRRWGRHKGTSAYACLTATHVGDWLTVLGFPPSRAPN